MDDETQYKYLGVWESDKVENGLMKNRVETEYFRRLRKILKTKLNAGNLTKAVNTWAVTLFRYPAGIVHWTKEEVAKIDRKTRKMIRKYGGLHPKADVDRLHVSRELGGRGLKSVSDIVVEEEQSLWAYVVNKGGVYEIMKEHMKEFTQVDVQEFRDNRKNKE